jgi:hypothetical protein
MSVAPVWPQVLDFFGTPLVIEPSPGQLSGGAWLLPVRQFDERIGLTRAFADALDDPRDPDLTEHTFLEVAANRPATRPAANGDAGAVARRPQWVPFARATRPVERFGRPQTARGGRLEPPRAL